MVVGGILLPEIRRDCHLPMPYRGVFVTLAGTASDAASTLGMLTIGPVMHAFAHYLHHEPKALRTGNAPVKTAFLLRDGHLPARAFTVWHHAQGLPMPPTPRLAISRFVAYGACPRSQADVDAYLAGFIGGRRFNDFARQLLLPADIAVKIVAQAMAAHDPEAEFTRLIHRPATLSSILPASTALRSRLIRYLQRGDTRVFVALGYEGTAQRLLAPVLRDELDVWLIARYLIASPAPGWRSQRAGLIDASWGDERAAMVLVRYIALLEDLCTAGGASVVDYSEDGEPILGTKHAPAAQVAAIALVQRAALDFVRTSCQYFSIIGEHLDNRALAPHSLLTRMAHAPTAQELDYLAGFQLDMGLGSDIGLRLFDLDAA